MNIVNIAAYKFVALPAELLPDLRTHLKQQAIFLELKGTILLSTEGINLFLAGIKEAIETFKKILAKTPEFKKLYYKESFSKDKPFSRMLVKIKKEIIPLGMEKIQPETFTAPRIPPETLKQWYEQDRNMIVLDTRNNYEVRLGTFKAAVNLHLDHFRELPKALEKLPQIAKQKLVVTFCTGGIRCEKAAAYMLKQGFQEVYQLDGGILNYFKKCGGEHYQGECFVFDKRVALNNKLEETEAVQCYVCQNPLTIEQQQVAASTCPYCDADANLRG